MEDTLTVALLLAAVGQLFWIMNKVGKMEMVIDVLLNECPVFSQRQCRTKNDVNNPKRHRLLSKILSVPRV